LGRGKATAAPGRVGSGAAIGSIKKGRSHYQPQPYALEALM
jgi:hypothetical protein